MERLILSLTSVIGGDIVARMLRIVHLIYLDRVPQTELAGGTVTISSALVRCGGCVVLCVFEFILVVVWLFFPPV